MVLLLAGCGSAHHEKTSARRQLATVVASNVGPTGGPPGPVVARVEAPAPPGVNGNDEAELGRFVAARAGCESCHRVGAYGNDGPGRNLTYVGSRLDARSIEQALIHPRQPMPSFRELPARSMRALVVYLSALRHR